MVCRFVYVSLKPGWMGRAQTIQSVPKHSYLDKDPLYKAHSDGPAVALKRNVIEKIVFEKFVKQIQAHVPDQIRYHPRLAHRTQ